MKQFSKFIYERLDDQLDDHNQLIKHSYIYYAFNKEKISEYFTFESIGLFNGCKEIVNYIIDNIDKFIKRKINIIKFESILGLTNHYFDILELKFENDRSSTVHGDYEIGYLDDDIDKDYNDKKWNAEKNIFNFIKITLYNCNKNNEQDIAEILTHELMHSWDDYILHLKSFSSLRNKNIQNKLKREFKIIKQNIKDKKIYCVINGEFDKADEYDIKLSNSEFINTLIYYLNNFEINAYISQINQVLRSKSFNNIEDEVDYISKNSSSYANYKYIYDLSFEDDGNIFLDYGASKSQLIKIRKLASKAWKKIINHTYHICIDHLSDLSNKLNEGSSNVLITNKLLKIWKR